MSKSFEEKIASELENIEAPVSKGIWEKIAHDLDHPFEKALKDRLNGITPIVGAGVWEGIEAQLPSEFEALVKNKVDNYQVPTNPAVWEAVDQRLEQVPSPFETKLQSKFDGFQAPPPTGTLEAIEAKLDEKRLVDWKKTGSTLVAMLLVFGTFLISPMKFSDSSQPAESVSLAMVDDNELEDDLINKGAFGTPNTDESTLAFSDVNDDDNIASDNMSANASVPAEGANSPYQINGGKPVNHSNQPNNYRLVAEAPTQPKGGYHGNNVARTGNGFNSILGPQFAINDLSGMEIPGLRKEFHPLSSKNRAILTPEKTKQPVSIGLMAALGRFGIKTGDAHFKGLFDSDFLAFDRSLRTNGSYSTVGTTVDVGLTEKTSFCSGLQVVLAREAMQFDIVDKRKVSNNNYADAMALSGPVETDSYHPQSNELFKKESAEKSELQLVPQEDVAPDSVVAGNQHILTNRIMMLDIPLGMEFKLKEKNKSSITARIGAKVRLVARANTFHSTNDRTKIVEVTSETSHTFYQASMVGFSSINYARKIGKDMEWYIGPEVNLNTTDLNRAGTWASMRPYQIGINMGIRQHMN